MSLLYDPPSGWRYGFPRPYQPQEGEKLRDTLIRDGYPEKDADFGAQWCRFIGPIEEAEQPLTETLSGGQSESTVQRTVSDLPVDELVHHDLER